MSLGAAACAGAAPPSAAPISAEPRSNPRRDRAEARVSFDSVKSVMAGPPNTFAGMVDPGAKAEQGWDGNTSAREYGRSCLRSAVADALRPQVRRQDLVAVGAQHRRDIDEDGDEPGAGPESEQPGDPVLQADNAQHRK